LEYYNKYPVKGQSTAYPALTGAKNRPTAEKRKKEVSIVLESPETTVPRSTAKEIKTQQQNKRSSLKARRPQTFCG